MRKQVHAFRRVALDAACLSLAGFTFAADQPPAFVPRRIRQHTDSATATVLVKAGQKSEHRVPRQITGKFAEHLGWNIYNGMDAQILRNPTFAHYPFWTSQMTPDGVTKFHVDDAQIDQELRRLARRFGWPDREIDSMCRARKDGLACLWTRAGRGEDVEVSPDTSPGGNRAQRIQIKRAGGGIAQWTWLPLHRVRSYEIELYVRSPDLNSLRVSLGPDDASASDVAEVVMSGLSSEWKLLRGSLEVRTNATADAQFRLAVRSEKPGQLVMGHVFLRPSDHVGGADPDVVRLLKESRLPILRWPGGNFVSGYHWKDGVGPVERRPRLPNYAWGGVEPNTFGTDEFIRFCGVVGCEPMICVNAGSGTPEEAAQWVEYCNGGPDTPMGRLRAAHGHAEPYGVKHWEVGNELWGRWQYHWTSAIGYVDRFKQFARAMRAVDSGIRLHACGAPVFWGKAWNDTLISGAAGLFDTITDHPLIGGDVDLSADPLDIYSDFMAVPEVLEQKWGHLCDNMRRAGISDPQLAVTELQLFAHLGGRSDTSQPARLTRENLPDQDSITEAIYDTLVYHAALRLAPFVEMVTHSATVNHGGGLRKERERVYANPCHYAQSLFAELAGATPVPVEIQSARQKAPRVLPELRSAVSEVEFSLVDAFGAIAADGGLLLSVVHRGTADPLRLTIQLEDFDVAGQAEIVRLTGATPWAGNSIQHPDAVVPAKSSEPINGRALALDVRPYTLLRVRVSGAR